MKLSLRICSRSLLGAAIGVSLTGLVITAGATSAAAAPFNRQQAEQACTPDVMRLCSEFIPDPNPIVRCLKAKRRQLSPACSMALSGGGKSYAKKSKKKRKRTARR